MSCVQSDAAISVRHDGHTLRQIDAQMVVLCTGENGSAMCFIVMLM